MSVSIDPTLRIKLSEKMLDILEKIDKDKLPQSIKSANEGTEVTLDELKAIFSLTKDLNDVPHFHQTVISCDIILPTPKFAERNPELEARIEALKAEQENREYERMTKGLHGSTFSSKETEPPVATQLREINNYLLLIFQFVLSIVTSFVAGYLGPYYFYGITDVGIRLIIGMILGFAVAIADLYFIVRHFLVAEGVVNLEELEKKYN